MSVLSCYIVLHKMVAVPFIAAGSDRGGGLRGMKLSMRCITYILAKILALIFILF